MAVTTIVIMDSQIEKKSQCEKLMIEASRVKIDDISIPSKAVWLFNFASQLLSEDSEDHFASSSVDNEAANPLLSFLHDIKCLEYSHTPLAKIQLLTSAFRKCGTILTNLKTEYS